MKSRGAPGIEAPWNLPIAAALCVLLAFESPERRPRGAKGP